MLLGVPNSLKHCVQCKTTLKWELAILGANPQKIEYNLKPLCFPKAACNKIQQPFRNWSNVDELLTLPIVQQQLFGANWDQTSWYISSDFPSKVLASMATGRIGTRPLPPLSSTGWSLAAGDQGPSKMMSDFYLSSFKKNQSIKTK